MNLNFKVCVHRGLPSSVCLVKPHTLGTM